MPLNFDALCFAANDPDRLADFWSGVLGGQVIDDPVAGVVLLPHDDTGFRIRFLATDEPKTRLNQIHFDLKSETLEEQQQRVAKALALGGTHLDVGQLPEDEHVVLADPEGNEFCVIEPGNNFLAASAFGALSSDGTQRVGHFWSKALGWPLVWDQDEETAIGSPDRGPIISWGGPPVREKLGKNRLHLDVAPPVDGDQQAEVDRLVSLGATRIDIGQGDVSWVVMADPDGNEFCVLTPR